MSDLTVLTLREARDGLKARHFSSRELVAAHLAAMEKGRGLNAYVLETPDHALAMADASDARRAKGEEGTAGGPAAWREGFVLHEWRAHHRLLQHSRQFRADI